jgi:UDP:flavonoid glycosyltransferase YjiC (YdhE family)
MAKKLIISTIGSRGDLNPFLAIGQALVARGHEVILASAAEYRATVESYGIRFAAIGPRDISVEDPELTALVFEHKRGIEFLHRRLLFPHLESAYRELQEIAAGSAGILCGSVAYAAPLAATKLGLPWASVVLQPSAMLSRHEMPVPPFFPAFRHATFVPKSIRGFLIAGFQAQSWRWGAPLLKVLQELNLPKPKGGVFGALTSPDLHIALFSKYFGAPQPDWPQQTRQTGFVFADQRDAKKDQLQPDLVDFLQSGPPPLVFTLGSAAVLLGKEFFAEAVTVAKALGQRAIFVAGRNHLPPLPESMRAFDYVPYSQLLKAASVVIHQAGVGTTAQTLMSGRPCLAVPFGADQFDNGHRLEKLGVGKMLGRHQFNAKSGARALGKILENANFTTNAQSMREKVKSEDGLGETVKLLERFYWS